MVLTLEQKEKKQKKEIPRKRKRNTETTDTQREGRQSKDQVGKKGETVLINNMEEAKPKILPSTFMPFGLLKHHSNVKLSNS